MKKIDHWDGQLEDTKIEYEVMTDSVQMNQKVDSFGPSTVSIIEYDKPDKMDYLVAASSGVLTGLLNSFWVGEFSLRNAQDWGRKRTNSFVIKVAQIRGYKKDELEGAIRFLEKDAPIPSDKLTGIWGGGLQHHFRDFSHHASVVGLVFSILTQFTGMSYGTDMKGHFEIYELPDRSLIGNNFEEKIFNGVVIWALHLVSDMAGSSNNAGKGTGIPGPILSLIKELSVLPYVRNLNVSCKNKQISMSMMLSKIFNGTAFEHASTKDLIRFDLRTELGIYAYGTKQSITVVLNQCLT